MGEWGESVDRNLTIQMAAFLICENIFLNDEEERERERESVRAIGFVRACVCVCIGERVCGWVRERKREREGVNKQEETSRKSDKTPPTDISMKQKESLWFRFLPQPLYFLCSMHGM